MSNSINTREIVLDMLLDVNKNHTPSHIITRETLQKYQYLDKADRGFISKVFGGTIENQMLIDYVINQFSKTPVNKMKPLIRYLLRMSCYQILFMDKTPDSAVCNEAVSIAKKRKFVNLAGFVNGVLRSISRGKDSIVYPNKETDFEQYLSVMYSFPEWLVKQIREQYPNETEAIIKASNTPPSGVSVRINTNKTDKQTVIEKLESDNITVCQSQLYENAIVIKDFDYLEKIPAFLQGEIIPQDVSSMLVGCIADPAEGDMCLDVCAAPGGKALHVAELLNNTGMVEARDVSLYKTDLIDENISRLGFTNVTTRVFDATIEDDSIIEKFDVVIADLPCSGLGVISKKSDIKYNMTLDGENSLVELQRSILRNAVKYVKTGGTLIYSTCTINKHENIDNFNWLKKEFGLQPCDISGYFSNGYHSDESKNGYIQFLPGDDGTDGFFISKFKK